MNVVAVVFVAVTGVTGRSAHMPQAGADVLIFELSPAARIAAGGLDGTDVEQDASRRLAMLSATDEVRHRDEFGTFGGRTNDQGLQLPFFKAVAGLVTQGTERGGFELGFGASTVGATL